MNTALKQRSECKFQQQQLIVIVMLQAECVKDAAWGCQWVGTAAPFVRSLSLIITMANKELKLTAGKFVPVSKTTMMNVRLYLIRLCKSAERTVCLSVCPSVWARETTVAERMLLNVTLRSLIKSVNKLHFCLLLGLSFTGNRTRFLYATVRTVVKYLRERKTIRAQSVETISYVEYCIPVTGFPCASQFL